MWSDDLEVFYDEGDFAVRCIRSRNSVQGAPFSGILATVDEDRFDNQITAGVHTLQYPTARGDLQQSDQVSTQPQLPAGHTLPAAQLWRVLRTPDRINDGMESVAYLKPVAVL